jgi:hypothetical protein
MTVSRSDLGPEPVNFSAAIEVIETTGQAAAQRAMMPHDMFFVRVNQYRN